MKVKSFVAATTKNGRAFYPFTTYSAETLRKTALA